MGTDGEAQEDHASPVEIVPQELALQLEQTTKAAHKLLGKIKAFGKEIKESSWVPEHCCD